MTAPKTVPAHSRNVEIDRLRAVAILLILVTHVGDFLETCGAAGAALLAHTKATSVGVDLFFVISGFVVSAVIVDRIDALPPPRPGAMTGYLTFIKAFYTKRVFRILPMAWLVLALFSVGFLAVWGFGEKTRYALETAAAAVGFSANYFLYFKPPTHFSASPFGPYWSLSIEEQFYFFYPLFLFAVRDPRRRAVLLALGVAAIGLVVRPLFFDAAVAAGHSRAAFATHFRCDGIMAGCFLYFASRGARPRVLPGWTRPRAVRVGLGLLTVVVLVELRVASSPMVALPAVVLVSMALVYLASREQDLVFPGDGAAGRALTWFGLRSYGLYLVNWPLLWLLDGVFPGVRALPPAGLAAALGAWLALSAILAELGYRLVERPLMRRGAALAAEIEAAAVSPRAAPAPRVRSARRTPYSLP